MTGKELTIRGLHARGFVVDALAKTSKYLVFTRSASDGIYLVGGAGGLRVCRGKLSVAGSISLTDSKTHKSFKAVGEQAASITSVAQADAVFAEAFRGLCPASV